MSSHSSMVRNGKWEIPINFFYTIPDFVDPSHIPLTHLYENNIFIYLTQLPPLLLISFTALPNWEQGLIVQVSIKTHGNKQASLQGP